jgi:hypothetical protein
MPLRPTNVTKRAFHKTLAKAETDRAKDKLPAIGKVRWHDLRHTVGSMKLDCFGAAIRAILGPIGLS